MKFAHYALPLLLFYRYDEVLVGTAEPESWLYNPLNRKAAELETSEPNRNGNEDYEQNSESQQKNFESFCEDPAIVRERMDRRRQEKYQQNKKFVAPSGAPNKDVVGKLYLPMNHRLYDSTTISCRCKQMS
jgi:hypothetical protein